ncbi:DCN1-like protein 5 [Balamuthia mandrillaris]
MGNSNRKKSKPTKPVQPTTSATPNYNTQANQGAKPSKTSSQSNNSTPRSTKTPESTFSDKRLESIFNKYKDEEDAIGPNGIENFCKDIGVNPDDVVMLVLAYHLDATEMGYFYKDEFLTGFKKLGCDSVEKIKEKMPKLRDELSEPELFKNIYRFVFTFAKEAEQKCLDMDMAIGMLDIILAPRYPLAKSFVAYLKEQDSYKGLNGDQWASLLEFCKTIKEDFSNYDENGAWPTILDEWVSWATKKEDASEAST